MPENANTAVHDENTGNGAAGNGGDTGSGSTARTAPDGAEGTWYGGNADDVLVVKGLRRSYGAVRAVDDVSFTLPHGGSLGIVGESGSGKTTTARIVVGLEKADEGEVHVRGRSRTERRRGRAHRLARAREVQMVFQDPLQSLDPRTSVEAALRETLRLHFPDRDHDRRVRELLDPVGLGSRAADARPR
ncbi:ATP-binding cassette domain-containing protein, partial [Streptomyces sp. NPDC059556]|uniref:ATP-binding cassette domain-containing protein n=1 Tax=Streptomyces sp. NPDC059556 TaxID=3346863 RepID=UPI00369FB10E